MGKSWEGWRWVHCEHEVLSMMNDTEYVRAQEGRKQEMVREAELDLEILVGKKAS